MSSILTLVVAFIGGGSLATILGYIFLRPKTRAEAAKLRSEAATADIGNQSAIAGHWKRFSEDLERRVKTLEESDRIKDERLAAAEEKLGEVETAHDLTRRILQAAVRFIDRLAEWGRSDPQTRGEEPRPDEDDPLHAYLKQDVWNDAPRV